MTTEPDSPSLTRAQAQALGIGAIAVLVLVAVVVFVLPGSSSKEESVKFTTGLGFPNADASNSRFLTGPIHAGTVSDLTLAWSLPGFGSEEYGVYKSSPVVLGGIVYSQDLNSNVQAIDLENGKVLWEAPYASPSQGPNGVFVADGRVYGATTTSAFALNQTTGKELWATTLVRNSAETIDMAPGYRDGLVFVSTIATLEKGGGVGILWALDAKTGKKVWSFDTVPKGLWGNPRVNSGGGLSYTPAIDDKGSMYFGVAGPAPVPGTKRDPWGSSRPGPNLYTSSVVKLSTRTGKLRWYYQLTPHNLCNWGLLGPPLLVKAGKRNLVIAAGKAGIVVALDQSTGKLVWKRAVGIHNGHDKDGLYAMRGEYSKLKMPLTASPGGLGGVSSPPSTNGSTVFVPVVNYSTTLRSQTEASWGRLTGELVALDVATGAIKWKHSFPTGAFGATTVVNDLVFAPTNGGALYVFESESGKELWRAQLPASVVGGIAVSGNTVIAPAGFLGRPAIVAYRLRS